MLAGTDIRGGVFQRRSRALAALVVTAVCAMTAWVAAMPVAAQPAPDGSGSQGEARVDQAVVDDVAAEGETDFWVVFGEKADLSGAYGIADWAARGAYVYDLLTTTAQRSQAAVAAELATRNVDYESMWIANAILVRGGDRATLDLARSRTEVAEIRATHTYQVPDPIDEGDRARALDGVEWGVANIGADQVWDQFGARGEGIVVANVDSGVEYTHPALVNQYRGNLGDGTFDHNYNWFDPGEVCGDPSSGPCDNNGHGTHTMGTMVGDDGAGNQIGVAPGAEWIAAKGCELYGCSDFALVSSGEWILAPTDLTGGGPRADLRPNVVNNSWGEGNGRLENPFYNEIVDAWTAAGIFGVFANGNEGFFRCDGTGSPADYVNAWGVGAYDSANRIADFSSRGPGEDGVTRPNISAPGVDVRSSVPGGGYVNSSGTSMAAPHQSGAVALMWSAAPALLGDIDLTRRVLGETAVNTDDTSCGGTAENNNVYGEGRLDAFAAVEQSPRGPTGTLTGTVTDDSGAPIAGAVVTVTFDGRPRTATTGSDGVYSFGLPVPVGTYDATAAAFGYTSATGVAEILEDQTTVLDFTLTPAPRHPVSGTVTDEAGSPVPGATVTLDGTPLEPAVTGDSGQYAFDAVPEGSYSATVSAGGCFDGLTAELVVDGPETLDVRLDQRHDAYGYSCRLEPVSYVEATNPLPLEGDRDESVPVDLPFPFPFYGVTYNVAHVTVNGFINFLVSGGTPYNTAIPIRDAPNGAIYAFWDYLRVDAPTAEVLTGDLGDRFVIEWRNVLSGDNRPGRWDFEIVLYESGEILLQYRNVETNLQRGAYATIGIENAEGTDALQYSYSQALLTNTEAIRFQAPPSGSLSGTIIGANEGFPLAEVAITATNGETTLGTATGDDGTYATALPLGTWTVTFQKVGFVTESRDVVVSEPAQAITLDIAMHSVASADPDLIETTLVQGSQDTFDVRLTNTGGAPLEWEALERGSTGAGGTLEWLQPPGAGVAMSGNASGVARPSAARWHPANAMAAPPGILVYADDYYHPAPNTYVDQALQRLGLEYTAFYDGDYPGFEAALSQGGWDLVIFAGENYALAESTFDALHEWVAGDGKLIIHSWQMDWCWRLVYCPHPLWAALGAELAALDYPPANPVHFWEPAHPLFTVPETVPEFTDIEDVRIVFFGQRVVSLPGFEALAGYTEDPAPAQAQLVLGNDDRTLFRGIFDAGNNADLDGDGVRDAVEFWTDSIIAIEQGFSFDVPWLNASPLAGRLGPGRSQTVEITVDTTGLAPGDYSAAVVFDGTAGPDSTRLTIPIHLEVTPFGVSVNAGGEALTDLNGDAWAADQAFDRVWGWSGPRISRTVRTVRPIGGTDDDALYRSARSGHEFTYRFEHLDNGTYDVELHLAEIQRQRQPGDRVFDVTANGTALLDGYDIAADVGTDTAVVQRFTVEVTNGRLRVLFRSEDGSAPAIVNAIRITRQSAPTAATPSGVG